MNKPLRPIEWFTTPIEGILEKPIVAPRPGRVKALGSIWNAQVHAAQPRFVLTVGDRVRIVGRQGITLLIVPLDEVLQQI